MSSNLQSKKSRPGVKPPSIGENTLRSFGVVRGDCPGVWSFGREELLGSGRAPTVGLLGRDEIMPGESSSGDCSAWKARGERRKQGGSTVRSVYKRTPGQNEGVNPSDKIEKASLIYGKFNVLLVKL
jgi:hypothetical protein